MLQKTNQPGFLKDPRSGAIINTNDEEYKRILAFRKDMKRGQDMADRMDKLEQELIQIKTELCKILESHK